MAVVPPPSSASLGSVAKLPFHPPRPPPLKAMSPGEKKLPVVFDPETHPALVHRGLLLGLSPDVLADLIGVDLGTFSQWMLAYPELKQAEAKAQDADAQVVESLFSLATGSWGEGNKKPDVIACLFWMKVRKKWSDQPPTPTPAKDPKDMTLEELMKLAATVSDKLAKNQEFNASDDRDLRTLPPE